MILNCARFILLGCVLLVLSASLAAAQDQPVTTPRPPRPENPTEKDHPPMGGFEEEIRAKRAIKLAEKDHQENLERARQILDLAKDLQASLRDKSAIDRNSLKKVDRLEKLTKKIRNEAGGEDEEVKIVDRPTDITGAVNQIADTAEALSKNVQDTPRQVVSASMINTANVLLELIKIARTITRPQQP
jgi:phosphoglycerate-specific signal transduction histidine kinase